MPFEAPEITPLAVVNPAAVQRLRAMSDGRSATALRNERDSVRQELEASGMLKPATIINFNPIPLTLSEPLQSYRVPAYNQEGRTEEMKIEIEFNGRVHTGSYMTIREPFIWPRIRGTRLDDSTGEDMGDYGIDYMLPIALAQALHASYNPGGATDSVSCGGVLVFEGDKHTILKKRPENILFPRFKSLPNRKRVFYTEERSFNKELKELFERQYTFARQSCRQADGYNTKDEERGNITDVHRSWGQYALDMHILQDRPEWMTNGNESERAKCSDCGTLRKDMKSHFCPACRSPYNAFESFMAGRPVPEQYLYSLTKDQIEAVKKEMARRKSIFAPA